MHVSCQLNLKLFVSKQYDFPPIVSCQLSQNLKFRVCQLSVRLVCQLSVKNMDDCQSSVNPIKTLIYGLTFTHSISSLNMPFQVYIIMPLHDYIIFGGNGRPYKMLSL